MPHASPAPPSGEDRETPCQRPAGALRGIGFIPTLWVTSALRRGLIPTPRAHTVLAVLADAVDADGRWSYLHIATISARTGGVLSPSTVKRALRDLEGARLIRRLGPEAKKRFFRTEIAARRRHADRLPEVVEILIPAAEFPRAALAEINAARAGLGEPALDSHTRPVLGGPEASVARAQSASDTGSKRPTDLSPTNPDPRDSSPTRVLNRRRDDPAPPVPSPESTHALRLLPDAALAHPAADRARIAHRLDALRGDGLSVEELSAAVEGWQHAKRPYPALMRRLNSVDSARRWIARSRPKPAPAEPAPTSPYTGHGGYAVSPPLARRSTTPVHFSGSSGPKHAATGLSSTARAAIREARACLATLSPEATAGGV